MQIYLFQNKNIGRFAYPRVQTLRIFKSPGPGLVASSSSPHLSGFELCLFPAEVLREHRDSPSWPRLQPSSVPGVSGSNTRFSAHKRPTLLSLPPRQNTEMSKITVQPDGPCQALPYRKSLDTGGCEALLGECFGKKQDEIFYLDFNIEIVGNRGFFNPFQLQNSDIFEQIR